MTKPKRKQPKPPPSVSRETLLRRIADRGNHPGLYGCWDDWVVATDSAQLLALTDSGASADFPLFDAAIVLLELDPPRYTETHLACVLQQWAGPPPRVDLLPCPNWRDVGAHLDIEECDCSWVPGLGWLDAVPSRAAEPASVFDAHFDRTRIAELLSVVDEDAPLTLWREGDHLHLAADGMRAVLMCMKLPQWPRERTP